MKKKSDKDKDRIIKKDMIAVIGGEVYFISGYFEDGMWLAFYTNKPHFSPSARLIDDNQGWIVFNPKTLEILAKRVTRKEGRWKHRREKWVCTSWREWWREQVAIHGKQRYFMDKKRHGRHRWSIQNED